MTAAVISAEIDKPRASEISRDSHYRVAPFLEIEWLFELEGPL